MFSYTLLFKFLPDPRRYPPLPLTTSLISFARFLNIFRLFVVVLMGIMTILGIGLYGVLYPSLFLGLATIYLVFALIIAFNRKENTLQANEQLAHSLLDITFLTTLAGLSGGMQSGAVILVLIITGLGAGLCSKIGWKLLVLWALITTMLNEFIRLEGLAGGLSLKPYYTVTSKTLAWFGQSWSINIPEAYLPSFFMGIAFVVSGAIANRLGFRLRLIDLEKNKHQARLELQLRINQVMMSAMDEGIILVDNKARIHQINRRAQKLLSLDLDNSLPSLRELSLRVFDHFYQWRYYKGLGECEFRINQNRNLFFARFLMVPPDHVMSIIFVQDQEHVRLQAQKLKMGALGLLTANIAHEIRNPLSAIHQSAEFLQEEAELLSQEQLPLITQKTGEETTDSITKKTVPWAPLVNIILEHSKRIDRIIRDVTDLGRRDRLNKTQWNLLTMVEEITGVFLSINNSKKNIVKVLELDIPPKLQLEFDENHFRQILNNLLDNAWHYCKKKQGSIRIHAHWDAGAKEVHLFLVDDGTGIPTESAPKVFEPFFTNRVGGSGLGLYVCRELAEANDAELTLLDNAPGAYFCLRAIGSNGL